MSSALLTTLLGFAVTILTTWIKGQMGVTAAKREGVQEADADANKEAQDARDRMAQANAAPRPRSSVLDRLRDGSA